MVEMVFENQDVCCRITYLPLVGRQYKAGGYNTIREFGIKHNCYASRRLALAGEIAISLTVLILFRRHGFLSPTRQLTLPSFAFSLFRKCAC